ncbi:hypothetical protein ACC691_37975, partial [Rhizobium johnstonii]
SALFTSASEESAALAQAAGTASIALAQNSPNGISPASLSVTPCASLLQTPDGVTLVDLPDGTAATYAPSADGASYSLTLTGPEYGTSVTVTPEGGVVFSA